MKTKQNGVVPRQVCSKHERNKILNSTDTVIVIYDLSGIRYSIEKVKKL